MKHNFLSKNIKNILISSFGAFLCMFIIAYFNTIDKSNILAIAKTGVNFISLGCLTHSAKPIDISLKVSK